MSTQDPAALLASAYCQLQDAPRAPERWLEAAVVMVEVGAEADAIGALRTCLRLDPHQVDALLLLSRLAARRGQGEESLRLCLRAVELAPQRADVYLRAGQGWLAIGDLSSAHGAFLEVVRLDPGMEDALAGLSRIHLRQRQPELALAALESSAARYAPSVEVATAWGAACRRLACPQRAVSVLDRALDAHQGAWERVLLWHERGKVAEALGDAAGAVMSHHEANRLRSLSHDSVADHRRVQEQIAGSRQPPQEALGDPSEGPRPVVVAGLPGAGMSVVAQLLAAHPAAAMSREDRLSEIERLRVKGHLFGDTRFDTGLAQEAYRRSWPMRPAAEVVVDASADNLMHLGLVASLRLGARGVCVVRDPVEALWSCYREAQGDHVPWATRVDWLGAVWRERERLLDHWQRVAPMPLLVVCYEDLLLRPEHEVRRLLAFCELPFDPACVTFLEDLAAEQAEGLGSRVESWLPEFVALRQGRAA